MAICFWGSGHSPRRDHTFENSVQICGVVSLQPSRRVLAATAHCPRIVSHLFDRHTRRGDHGRATRGLCLLVRQSDGTVSRLSRARISFPVLKAGIALFEIWTATPVRGLRPVRAPRILAENAPKPRSSTRSPRRKASAISSSIALTLFSMSR